MFLWKAILNFQILNKVKNNFFLQYVMGTKNYYAIKKKILVIVSILESNLAGGI
jgi:hypothetical protein